MSDRVFTWADLTPKDRLLLRKKSKGDRFLAQCLLQIMMYDYVWDGKHWIKQERR